MGGGKGLAGLTGVSFSHRLGGEQEAVLVDEGVMETIYLPVHSEKFYKGK